MFEVKSYITIPDKKITDLNELIVKPHDFFVEISNETEIHKFADRLDLHYLNGAIYLQYGEQVLMDFTLWDIVDQLWGYFLNIIEDVIRSGKGDTYFPDQPVKLEIESISSELLLFSIDEGQKIKCVLPKFDFFSGNLRWSRIFL